jgi:hypothetical protein
MTIPTGKVTINMGIGRNANRANPKEMNSTIPILLDFLRILLSVNI